MLGNVYLMPSLSFTVPVCDGPGVEAADSLVSHNAQVRLVVFPVPPDVSQHAAWHGDNSSPASLQWAWEHDAASGLLFILGRLLCQAVLREETVSAETQEDCSCGRAFPPFHYADRSHRMSWVKGL